jgi:hypothetical protein
MKFGEVLSTKLFKTLLAYSEGVKLVVALNKFIKWAWS